MQDLWLSLDAVIAVLSVVVGFYLHKRFSERKIGDAQRRAELIIKDAEREIANRHKSADLEAKEAALKGRVELEEDARRRGRDAPQVQDRIVSEEEGLARKLDHLDRRPNRPTPKGPDT